MRLRNHDWPQVAQEALWVSGELNWVFQAYVQLSNHHTILAQWIEPLWVTSCSLKASGKWIICFPSHTPLSSLVECLWNRRWISHFLFCRRKILREGAGEKVKVWILLPGFCSTHSNCIPRSPLWAGPQTTTPTDSCLPHNIPKHHGALWDSLLPSDSIVAPLDKIYDLVLVPWRVERWDGGSSTALKGHGTLAWGICLPSPPQTMLGPTLTHGKDVWKQYDCFDIVLDLLAKCGVLCFYSQEWILKHQ